MYVQMIAGVSCTSIVLWRVVQTATQPIDFYMVTPSGLFAVRDAAHRLVVCLNAALRR